MAEKGTHNVKFIAEKIDKSNYTVYTRMGNGAESTYAYNRLYERWQSMQPTANGNSIMETQKSSIIDRQFSTCRECFE